MSKRDKALLVMLAALAGQATFGKIAKQQAAILGIPAIALVALAAIAGGAL